jgi:signal transduction histidine kinase
VVPDRELIHAAVLNVVRNAIEASGNGGQVRVDLSVSGEETSLTVLDNGPGVPENLAGRIFEPFVTGRPEGVGLGLALARQAAEATGGELTWQRNDGWTRFRFHWHNLPPAG